MTPQEAIKNLKKLKSFHNGSYGTAIDLAIKALEQTMWIPVSERLPEDEQECLITYKGIGGFHIDLATYSTNLYKVDKYDFHTKKDISGFYGFDTEYGYYEWSDVVAWMPLPQPYKEGEE